MLQFHTDQLTIENAQRLENWRNLSKPLMQANSGKYRDKLNETEIRYIEALCAEPMELFGYERDYPLEEEPEAILARIVAEGESRPAAADELGDEEKTIREQRLSIIHRILARPRSV